MSVASKPLMGGKVDFSTPQNLSTARTGVTTIASPSAGADLVLLGTAGTYGGYISSIKYQFRGTGTQAAALIYIWRTDTSGANAEIVDVFTVTAAAAAMSNTNNGQYEERTYNDFNLQSGQKVYASVSVLTASCTVNIIPNGGQFEGQ